MMPAVFSLLHRCRRVLTAGLLLLCVGSAQAAITVVLSERGSIYSEFSEAFTAALPSEAQRGLRQVVVDGETPLDQGELGNPATVVAVGVNACRVVARGGANVPVLCVLLPRVSFERAVELSRGRGRYSAIYLDQPLGRQLGLIRLIMPGRHRVGILAGPDTRSQLPRLKAVAGRNGAELLVENVDSDDAIVPALNRLLPQTDLLLALPDSVAYNRNAARSVLLTSYRYQRPLIAFSQAYVTAGALAAVYSSPAQVARQAAEAVRGLLSHGSLPGPRYPSYFSVAVNRYVARSLGLEVADEAALSQELQRADSGE